jgi:hypothetical protein
MRKLVFTLLLVIVGLSIANCAAKPVFPTGVFLHESSGDVITLQEGGLFTASGEDGVLYLSGTYTIDGNRLTVTTSDERMCEPELPETYTWIFDGSILSVSPINEDACLLRSDVFNLIRQ